jgi:V8-like Glu-specific endopeptidase
MNENLKKTILVPLLGAVAMLVSSCLTDQSGNTTTVDGNGFEVALSKAIVGNKDSRILMPNQHVNPTIVALVKGADGVTCTGTTIGLSHVITAAHCVYDEEKKEFKTGISLIPGLHLAGNMKKGSRYFIKRVFIMKDYVEDTRYNGYTAFASSKDIAVIQVLEFKENDYFSEDSPKTFFADINSFKPRGQKVGMIAYHYDDATEVGSQYYTNDCYTQGKRNSYTAFFHDCDTAESSSGAAIISNGEIVGIHTGKAGGNINNTGAMITRSILEDIEKITLYETEGLVNFQVHEPKVSGYSTVSVKNNCDEAIDFSVAFKNSEGRFKSTHRTKIPPQKLQLLNVDTKESHVYFNGRSESGNSTWDGSHSFSMGGGVVMDFMTVDLVKLNGDTTIKLNCN